MDGLEPGGGKAGLQDPIMRVSANVLAANFWPATLYAPSNTSGLDNAQLWPSIGSLSDMKYNQGGLVDFHCAPKLPERAPEENWLRTVPGKGWFTLFGLCSLTEPFYDRSWKPEDFERVS